VGRDAIDVEVIWVKSERDYFCGRGWTGQITLMRHDKLDFWRSDSVTFMAVRTALRARVTNHEQAQPSFETPAGGRLFGIRAGACCIPLNNFRWNPFD
jgi:hypothetical protein